jgi:hypothetical protein
MCDDNPEENTPGNENNGGAMPQNGPCTVAWCDHDCRWEYETDGLPAVLSAHDLLAEAQYLTEFGHPPFRWHSRLWPSGLCMEQNEFLLDADPMYVAEHGRLMIGGPTCPAHQDPWSTKPDLDRITRMAAVAAQLAVDLAEAAAVTRVAPDYIGAARAAWCTTERWVAARP